MYVYIYRRISIYIYIERERERESCSGVCAQYPRPDYGGQFTVQLTQGLHVAALYAWASKRLQHHDFGMYVSAIELTTWSLCAVGFR